MPRYNGGFIGHDGLDAPDAPTIGTPSAGSAQADIAFTAGAAGTTATTEFVATTNDGIGATGTSSPITITGLTNGTSYTARVYAKNSHGTSAASAASASFTPLANVIDGLFQTTLWDGTGSSQTITNNINISGKGGLVWIKRRDGTDWHNLYDTERGAPYYLNTNRTDAQGDGGSSYLTALNNNGFTLGGGGWTNQSSAEYVGWTFRKQPKFFDIVTYTGTGSAQNISHNLGSVPGMIIVKLTSGSDAWHVYHRGVNGGTSPEDYYLQLSNTDEQIDNASIWNDTAPTSSVFTVGTNGGVNGSGSSYVAYLFAHNNNDGGFGETEDQDIIKCGNYTGNASTDGVTVDLGFEPQWLLFKDTSNTSAADWIIIDNMRGMVVDNDLANADAYLRPNSNNQEGASTIVEPTPTGFKVQNNGWTDVTGANIVYVAIRKGGMRTPTAASSVFAVDSLGSTGDGAAPAFRSPFVADMGMRVDSGEAYTEIGARLTQEKWLYTNLNNAEATANNSDWDYQNGWYTSTSTASNYHGLMWARARGYFDVATYSGTGSARTVGHNLGVVPEMMWIKRRDSTGSWNVYHKGLNGGTNPEQHVIYLEANEASNSGGSAVFNNTAPTSSVFTVNTNSGVNNSSGTYIAYLFATVAGVSKVGSFTQSGATNVDCGFTGSTPALIILKRTDSTGDWYIFDSLRGIIAGNDPYKVLNEQTAAVTNADIVDPYSGGFATTSSLTNGSYIFYAIAAIS